jgi:small subunit ribosomal protein S6
MADEQITYDLVLLLETTAEDAVKQRVLASTRSAIEAKGEVIRHDEWGVRQLAYPIDHKTDAEYHLFQFHVADVTLLSELERTLRITDSVLRSMITKLKPGTPEPQQPSSARGARHAEDPAPAAPAAPAAA